MRDWLNTGAGIVASIGTIAAISLIPDGYFLDRIYVLSSMQAQSEARFSAEIRYIQEDVDQHHQAHNSDAALIADELGNLRLLIEESTERTERQIKITSLEQKITDTTDEIIDTQQEIDRLDRVINGNTAAPASEETYRARERATANLAALEARLEGSVRELSRIMR